MVGTTYAEIIVRKLYNAECRSTTSREKKSLPSTWHISKDFGSSLDYCQLSLWQESVSERSGSHLKWLKDGRVNMMTRKGKIKLSTSSQ